jgi:hypothetical protein
MLQYIRNAQTNVQQFTDIGEQDVISESLKAVDSMDCDAFLDSGIEAFRSIEKADLVIRKAVLRSKLTLDFDLDDAIVGLFRSWLSRADFTEEWISRCERNGYELDNLVEFKNCVAEARAIVEFDCHAPANDAILRLGAKAIEEHRRGETVEWVPCQE